MSGIVGLWNLDGQPVDRLLLAGMSSELAHRGPDGEGCQFQSSFGMACQNMQVTPESINEIQPLVHPSGAMIVFDGRIDNREEIFSHLKGKADVPGNLSDAALLLSAYYLFKERLPEYLIGDFAFAIFDPVCQQLLLVRDAIGVKPLYYCHRNNIFVFASEIKCLLAHPGVFSKPNDQALAHYLLGNDINYGCPDGNTLFEEVYSVPPAHILNVTAYGVKVNQYWDFNPDHQVRFGSFQEYGEVFHQYFRKAVQRRIRSAFPVAVSVSGGLDSSAIFCQAESLRRQNPSVFPCIAGYSRTFKDDSPADEKKYLYMMEQMYGVQIEKIPMSTRGFLDVSKEAIWHMEAPLLDANLSDTYSFYKKVGQAGARTFLTGHWGDQFLSNMSYLFDLFDHLQWAKVFQYLKEYPRWMTDADPINFRKRTFFRNLIRHHLPEAVVPFLSNLRNRFGRGQDHQDWYTDYLQNLAQRPHSVDRKIRAFSAHFESLYGTIRSSSHISTMEDYSKMTSPFGLEIAFPFLDRDLIVFLMGIPGEIISDQGCPKALLRQSMRGILPEDIRNRRDKADFTEQLNASMNQNLVQLDEVLQPDAQAVKFGYINREMISLQSSEIIEQVHNTEDAVLSWKLERLFGLETWLRMFFHGKQSQNI